MFICFIDNNLGERRSSGESSNQDSCHGHGLNLEQALEKAKPDLSMLKDKLVKHNVVVADLWDLDKQRQDALGLTDYEKLTYESAKKHHIQKEHGKTI